MTGTRNLPTRTARTGRRGETENRNAIYRVCFGAGAACEAAAAPAGVGERICEERADNLRHLGRGDEVVVAVASHNGQPALRRVRPFREWQVIPKRINCFHVQYMLTSDTFDM